MLKTAVTLACAGLLAGAANAQIRITEWMYQNTNNTNEWAEITNTGSLPVSLATYSFDDNSRVPGSFMLSGTLAPGASAIITDILASDFRTLWNLPADVLIFGGNTNNLSRADEVNIYDGLTLIDRLTYDDQTLGNPRTNGRSGITTPANWGNNMPSAWFSSTAGDVYGSRTNPLGDVGSPGVVPTPGAAALIGLGALAAGRRRR